MGTSPSARRRPDRTGSSSHVTRLMNDARRQSLLLDRRRRGHLALLSSVLAVSVFAYLLLEPRTVQVEADGRQIEFETSYSNDAAVISAAGISVGPGDRITALQGDDKDVLRIDRAREVTLTVDGERFKLMTHAGTIDQLLSEAGVTLAGRDSVWQDGSPVSMAGVLERRHEVTQDSGGGAQGEAAIDIEVRRAVAVTVIEQGREIDTTTSRSTVAQVLREAGIIIGPGDRVTPTVDALVESDARIDVRHAMAVTLALPDDHLVVYSFARTVGDVLTEAGVVLPEGAFVDPPAETLLSAGLAVRVIQLSSSREMEREFIESRAVYRSDPTLGPGETRTELGHDGALVRRYDVSYVNGEEAGRELIEEFYDPEPADTVIYYPVQTGRDASAPAEGEIARVINVYATYYTPESAGRSASDPAYGRTATGVLVTYGVVAVDPAVIPLGTRMFIPGYGYAVAADTGGGVKGYLIDLGYPDGVVVDWRSRWLDIYILS